MKKLVMAPLLIAAFLTGCISPKSYVDPQYHKASYETIQRLQQPIPVKVNVEFQRNENHLPKADNSLRTSVEQVLRASGVFAPNLDSKKTISITANNFGDLGAAVTKGIGTGLTFGAIGSMVSDNYDFSCSFISEDGKQENAKYKHVIYTTIGNKKGPEGLTPTLPADAFNKVVEDVVLNFVKDLQDKGSISQ